MHFKVCLSLKLLYFLGLVGFIPNCKSLFNHVHCSMTVVIYAQHINNDNRLFRYQTKLRAQFLYINYCKVNFLKTNKIDLLFLPNNIRKLRGSINTISEY